MPNEFKDIVPVLAVIAGWSLNEFGQYLRVRREDRKALARALAELMEVHHQTSKFSEVITLFKERLGSLPPTFPHIFYLMMERLIGSSEDTKKRYDEAISLVASADPVLGFRLRSSDSYPKAISKLRMLALRDAQTSLAFQDLEPLVDRQTREKLKDLILEVAKKHGYGTWFRVKRMLNKRREVPPELESLLQKISELNKRNPIGLNPDDMASILAQLEDPSSKK